MTARNQHLIGDKAAAGKLLTPALVIDLDILERNIAAMAGWAAAHGIALRPHAKTHKSPEIARRQIDAGAVGICCATVKELEVLSEAGVTGLLLTTGAALNKAGWIAQVNLRATDMAVVVDHMDYLAALGQAAEASGKVLKLMVDVDPGLGRTGVASAADAVALARAAVEHNWLDYAGLQAYMGDVQHIPGPGERQDKIEQGLVLLDATVEALRAVNLNPALVSGGGTGSHRIDQAGGRYGELQAGSYVFMDTDYNAIDISGAGDALFETSLFVQTSVVNVNHPAYAVTDAGLKSFATDGPLPTVADGAPAGSRYRYMGDEHGALVYGPDAEPLALGAWLRCTASHCDPTVNLYDYYHGFRGGELVEIWPVAARGNN